MAEFWESIFKDKQEMWGFDPADSAITTLELFKKHGLTKILIPGFGYGRNAKVFTDQGCSVTGIEISETAIEISKKHFKENIKVFHGSVGAMPFDKEVYDGIYCYSLIHLLNEQERINLIRDCYHQLKPGGYMVFIAISKTDFRYGQGKELSKDTFGMSYGVTLFFYDSDSIQTDFGVYGLVEAEEISEPTVNTGNMPTQKFWNIVCRKK